jgi:hypothetical protein
LATRRSRKCRFCAHLFLPSHTQQPDLFADLPAFRTYARRGLDVELSFAKAAELSAADAKAVFDLCKVGVR